MCAIFVVFAKMECHSQSWIINEWRGTYCLGSAAIHGFISDPRCWIQFCVYCSKIVVFSVHLSWNPGSVIYSSTNCLVLHCPSTSCKILQRSCKDPLIIFQDFSDKIFTRSYKDLIKILLHSFKIFHIRSLKDLAKIL